MAETELLFPIAILGFLFLVLIIVLANLVRKVANQKSMENQISKKMAWFHLIGDACNFLLVIVTPINTLAAILGLLNFLALFTITNLLTQGAFIPLFAQILPSIVIPAALAIISISTNPRMYRDIITNKTAFPGKYLQTTNTKRLMAIVIVIATAIFYLAPAIITLKPLW